MAVQRSGNWVGSVEVDEPKGAGVLVHVTSAGICGSDLHQIQTRPAGMIIGHEFGGLLEDDSPVAVQPFVPCGRCAPCREGRDHLCPLPKAFYGVQSDGGMAERILVDPSALIRLPASIDLRNAGLVEPLAVVLHGLHRIGSLKGRRLAVVGGGSVGLLAVAAALTAGAKVDLHARHEVQRKAGSALGARTDITQDYEIVIDAAGSQSAIDLASDIVAPGGSILELGMFWNAVTVSRLLLRKEVNLLPSMLYGHDHQVREFDQAATLLAALPELASVVVTHRFPLEDAARAFRVAADRRAGAIKVLLMPAIPLQF